MEVGGQGGEEGERVIRWLSMSAAQCSHPLNRCSTNHASPPPRALTSSSCLHSPPPYAPTPTPSSCPSTHLLLVLGHQLPHLALLLRALGHLRQLQRAAQAGEQRLQGRVEQLKVEGELALKGTGGWGGGEEDEGQTVGT